MFLSLTHTRTTHTKHQDFMENLNSSFVWIPKTISNILLEVSMIDDFSKKSARLDSYVHLLEEEMRKIQVFQRELPQCMNLIQDAIERLKKESSKWKAKQAGPVMEQFLPLKSDPIGNGGPKSSLVHPKEKTNWLSSVQLWSNPIHPGQNQADYVLHLGGVKYQEGEGSRLLQGCNIKNRGGAFVPFKKPIAVEEDRKRVDDDGLSLSIPTNVPAEEGVKERGDSTQLNTLYQQQRQKKHRRCWSPELHKRFVDALQQLGGPKSATPKQIRDLMNVDGLTNDEVKSHLQKYRIHLKKLPSSSTGPLAKFSWNDNCADVARAMPGQSSSPQGPFQNGGSAKVGSTTGGDSMEEDEDDKSESQSWRSQFQGPGDKRAHASLVSPNF